MSPMREIASVSELQLATATSTSARLVIRGRILNCPSFRLNPGQELIGAGESPTIEFSPGVDGVQLTAGNTVRDIALLASPECRAIHNDESVEDLEHLTIECVRAAGQVQILATGRTRTGHVSVRDLDIVSADLRNRQPQAQGFGVHVIQGAFTLWNLRDTETKLTADLRGISVGRPDRPVLGSGVFVGGAAANSGGRVEVSKLETGPVFTNGEIVPGTAGLITGGVSVSWGAYVRDLRNCGEVTTYGTNDMILDNWGTVERWVAEKPLTSHGASAIAFVNFGEVGELSVQAPIETFGKGARGFNEYVGSAGTAEFDRIVTHADAGAAIQIAQPVRRLMVHRGIETHGGSGQSLVQGKLVELAAYGISVLPGGDIEELSVDGGIVTRGVIKDTSGSGAGTGSRPVPTLDLAGRIGALRVSGGIQALGDQHENPGG